VRRRHAHTGCARAGPGERLATPPRILPARSLHTPHRVGRRDRVRARGSAVGTLTLPTGAQTAAQRLHSRHRPCAPRWAQAPSTGRSVGSKASPPRGDSRGPVVFAAADSGVGAGPDAAPLVDFAAVSTGKVTLVDHRPRTPSRALPIRGACHPRPSRCPAGGARSHTFLRSRGHESSPASDLGYLRALAATTIPYVGLLGPAVRREKLLSELGAGAHRLRTRLHAPVGLPWAARTPESIALAIVAELHAFVHRPATSRSTVAAAAALTGLQTRVILLLQSIYYDLYFMNEIQLIRPNSPRSDSTPARWPTPAPPHSGVATQSH